MPKLCVIPGDGIGQEVIPAAVRVLQAVIPDLDVVEADGGWDCFQRRGSAMPQETLDTVQACGAALFGAVSSPSGPVAGYRSAILTLRQSLDLYANIRPVIGWPGVAPRPDVDIILVRENSEGLYLGRERTDGETAIAERVITRRGSERIARKAISLCQMLGRRKLTIVHKANVLPLTDGLFRDAVREMAASMVAKGELEINELLVDVAALKMVGEPEVFDVVVTTNLFGDILSDAAAYWGGGLGMAPSLNWGDQLGVAEPVHGSAPDIVGQGMADPTAAILSGAMLARFVWEDALAADRIEAGVRRALAANDGANVRGITTNARLEQMLKGLDQAAT
jgi:homoisocitrate dehydrogenase